VRHDGATESGAAEHVPSHVARRFALQPRRGGPLRVVEARLPKLHVREPGVRLADGRVERDGPFEEAHPLVEHGLASARDVPGPLDDPEPRVAARSRIERDGGAEVFRGDVHALPAELQVRPVAARVVLVGAEMRPSRMCDALQLAAW
jgi:hypothetical protein